MGPGRRKIGRINGRHLRSDIGSEFTAGDAAVVECEAATALTLHDLGKLLQNRK